MRDDDESAHVQIVHVVQDLLIRGRVLRGKAPVIGGEKELANLFLDAHVAQSGFHPVVCGGGPNFYRAPGGEAALLRKNFFFGSGAQFAALVLGPKKKNRAPKLNKKNYPRRLL